MVVLTLLRRAGPARLVAGMRVSSAPSSFARPMVCAGAMSIGVRAFSGSVRRFGCGTTDISISQELEELKYKQDSVTHSGGAKPKFLTDFLERGIWSINDVRGNDKVKISRKFRDEDIRVIFSIGLKLDNAIPVCATLSITKSTSPGALRIYLECYKDRISVTNVSFCDDTELVRELTGGAHWKPKGLYISPQFDTLDYGLREEFGKYLQERGLDRSVALFIHEYAAYKDQQEHVRWSNKVKNFVDL